MKPTVLTYHSRSDLNVCLAKQIKQIIDQSISENGVASIAFSGGSTPVGMLEQLSQLNVEWSKVKVTLVDDRWVMESHTDSNALLLKKHLISKVRHLRFFSLVTAADSMSAFEAEEKINRQLGLVLPQLDLAVLGMGTDGHTASFFPGSPQLRRALDTNNTQVCLATSPTNAKHDRMTLSLAFLLKSQHLILHFTGKDKQLIFSKALCSGLSESFPVSFILNQNQTPVTAYYAD